MNQPEDINPKKRIKTSRRLKVSGIKFPENQIKTANWVHFLIFAVLGLMIVASVGSIFTPHFFGVHFELENYQLHSTVEALGAIAAILVAFMPLQALFGESKPSFVFLSTGFLVMGLWDMFHSFYTIGNGFVFTHSSALFGGGFMFSLFVFPWKSGVLKLKKYLMLFFGLLAAVLAVLASLNRELFPEMVHDGIFTKTANNINFIAGLFFLISSVKLFAIYIRERNLGVLILVFTTISSAVVGITFQYSAAWSDGWWLWHFIRLIAFIAVLTYLLWRVQALSKERNQALQNIKNKHNQLMESEERFSLVSKATMQGLWDWNVLKKEVYFSPVWKMQVGYKDDELENFFDNWVKLLHPDDSENCLKAIDNYLKNPEGKFIIEFRLRHKNGHYVWIHNQAASVKDNEGNVVRMFGAHTDITIRKEAEEQIKQNEKKFKGLFENDPSAIIIADPQTGLLFDVNPAAEKLMEMSRKELIGLHQSKLHPEDVMEEQVEKFKKLQGNPNVKVDSEVLTKNGIRKPVEINVSMVEIENKPYILGIFHDISNLVEKQKQLKQSEEKIKQEKEFTDSVINAMPGIFYLFNENGKFLKWNNTLTELSGLNFGEVGTKSPMDFIAPHHRKKVAEAIQTAFIEGNVLVEADFLEKGKSPVPFLFKGKIIFMDKEPLLVGVGIDITKRIKAEQEREKALYDLNERMKEITCLFEINEAIKNPEISIPDVMDKITQSIPKGWQYPKKTCARVVLEKQEFKSKNFKVSNIYIEEPLIVTNKKRGLIQVFVFDLPEEQEKSPFLKEEKQLLSTIANNVGIYINRVESAQKLEKAMEKLQLSNKELERFAYVASHDLQEPLRMVSSYTQLLERRYKGKLDERADKYIYYAVDGANRMQNLINDLLDFSRVSTRGEKFETFDTNAVLKNVMNSLSVRIEETGAEIKIDTLPEIKGDKTQIERVFLNLIANAIKFRTSDKKPLISVDAKSRKNNWLFTVKDNGIGIDEKFQEKVFVIFQRLHGGNQYKGTGIGLAICKRIVQRHGGDIWFESEEGKGTTFFFTIKK